MAVKIAGRYRGRVIAWTRRSLVPGTVLALATIGPLAPGLAGGPSLAGADGIMLVEAGAFWMGRDSGALEEAPRHRVYVRDFWLERDKVTNRELAEFLGARGLRSPEGVCYVDPDDPDVRIHRRDGRLIADAGFEAHPAVAVSWFGARDCCLWRGRRLPTEAEWEKAATEPAGVQDLLGSLREWTGSAYRPYPYRADDGREQAALDEGRVVRGASLDDPADAHRVTIRRVSSYDGGRGGLARGHPHTGFRCATSEDLGGR
jgi:formylglycine-generating enzyme required for sulfatase activity